MTSPKESRSVRPAALSVIIMFLSRPPTTALSPIPLPRRPTLGRIDPEPKREPYGSLSRARIPFPSGFQSFVSRTLREEVVVWLNVRGQVHCLPRLQLAREIQVDRLAVFVLSIPHLVEPGCPGRHGLDFAALRRIRRWDLFFGEDRLKGAFGDASAAIDAGIRIYVVPRPLIDGLTRYDALHRADIYARRITQAQTGDDMRHLLFLRDRMLHALGRL